MSSYESFAEIYDKLMEETPYEYWKELIVGILKENNINDGLILDLGCGTGKMTRLLSAEGYDMTGVDLSYDMLSKAMEQNDDGKILYLCQDMREFELYGTMRAIVSVCDCMNYMLEKEDLTTVLKLANNYLDPGGLFIFDMNTPYKFKEVLGDNTYADSFEDSAFIWNNWYDEDSKINSYELTLFYENEDGTYDRFDELHEERGYEISEVLECIKASGMELVKYFDAETKSDVTDKTQRIFYIVKEKGKTKNE